MFGLTRHRRRLRRGPGVFPIALPVFAKLLVAAAAIASACTASGSLAATRPLTAGSGLQRATHTKTVDRLAAVPAANLLS